MRGGPLPYLLVGNPENRRVSLFQEALERQGRRPATVVSWRELLEGPEPLAALPDEPALLRIDSAGESFEVERGMLRLGYEAAVAEGVSTIEPRAIDALVYDRGRILCPRQHHLGFLSMLGRIGAVLGERPGWRPLSPLASIAELFDKRATSRRYAAAGIPVPEPISPSPSTMEELRAGMEARGWPSVFVKMASASSASCLGVFERGGDGERLLTTIEDTPRAWYNTLRVRRLHEPARIEKLLGFLLREGSQIERAVPKARLDGAFFDCRVLCVAGEPAFVVARQNSHPITNLHLGGWRGKPESLEAQVPAAIREAALESCRQVASLHGCLQVGVDVMYESGFTGHRVLEANAFGDLLPNLHREGLDVYEWQIRCAAELHG